ncbi:hypothetical protein BaRGS_00016276 [Batillaria attramentaria]|uniref:Ig-like domain-containing protein n=1 Tax=Batillaria attramentaria TaxID=370345 RepID=A0ABD0KZ08_9CAEN
MFREMFLTLLLLCLSAFKPTEAIRIGCSDPGRLEGRSYTFHCTLGDSSNTGSWSLISPTGQVTDIGFCVADGNCSSPAFSNFRLKRWAKINYLAINGITKTSTGILVCSEHHSDGAVETVNCTLNVRSVLMLYCGRRGYEFTEKIDQSVFCFVSNTTRPITWSLVTPSGQAKHLGSCQSVYNCSSPDSPYIIARMTYIGSKGAVVENCTKLQFHRSNWTVMTTCDVTMAYSALGRYGYRVRQTWRSQFGCSRYEDSDFLPYTPSAYISTSTGKRFYRGTYTVSWPLSTRFVGEGTYSYWTYTYPGQTGQMIEGSLVVERPSPPSVQCEGALRDTGRVPYVCSTSSLGSPAGRLIWFSGDTVLAAGQYGVTSLQFPSNVTVDGCDVMEITCWTREQNSPDTHSTDNVWGITVSAVLALFVVAVVILVILLRRRGLSSRGGGDPDAGTVHFQQRIHSVTQAEDPFRYYTGLNIQHVARAGRARSTTERSSVKMTPMFFNHW